MRSRLFAALILASWSQAKADEGPRPDPPGRQITLNVPTSGGAGRARNKLTLVIPEPPPPADDGNDPPVLQPPKPLDLKTAVATSENFDRWIFGEKTEKERQEKLVTLLHFEVGDAVRWGKLNDQEGQKLMLAGRGDIKRFLDQVEDRRREFEMVRGNFQSALAVLRKLEDLSDAYQKGPFGEGSLFAKTLKKIESDAGKVAR